ncbi:MAG TPA: hypothetical protein VF950_25945 [Planctomycetota bacterium]
MSRPAKVGCVGLSILVLLIALPGYPPAADAVFALIFGWLRFGLQVLPKISVNAAGVGMALACVALAAVVGHRFCLWLRQGEPWHWRWTAAGLAGVVVLFASGMAFTGVAHQAGWLLRSPLPLTRSSGGNERNASSSLKTIASAQADFRGNDRDGDKVQNFWRTDIQGLYSLKPEGSEEMIKLIELSVAGADGKPSTPVAAFTVPSPKAGYWYRALRFKDEKEPDPNRFAAISYPDTPSAGLYMFIISHDTTIFRKLVGMDPIPEIYPDDPLKEGWSKLD